MKVLHLITLNLIAACLGLYDCHASDADNESMISPPSRRVFSPPVLNTRGSLAELFPLTHSFSNLVDLSPPASRVSSMPSSPTRSIDSKSPPLGQK